MNEATVRIKINKLLEAAGWRFFADDNKRVFKMKTRLTPHLIDLTKDAALRSFWYKKRLSSFLESAQLSDLPAWFPGEFKRDYLDRVFESRQKTVQGRGEILRLAQFLAEQSSFPDLEGLEDSEVKIKAAERAIRALRDHLSEHNARLATERQQEEARSKLARTQARTRTSQQTLKSLEDRLGDLAGGIGSAPAGKAFERWFYDLIEFSEITSRRPFKNEGREIDGSISIGDTTYLIECKFTKGQTGAPDIDTFRAKVESKADNTMGVFVSISGYTKVARNAASGRKTPLLLLDSGHLYRVLRGISSFKDLVERIRRHASQTSEAYLSADGF